jgi:hypothetical protein
MADIHRQPFIHDCNVVVYDGRVTHTFRLFCKNHCKLQRNKSTVVDGQIATWRGDIIVMRVGKRQPDVVNMRGKDARLSDFVVAK